MTFAVMLKLSSVSSRSLAIAVGFSAFFANVSRGLFRQSMDGGSYAGTGGAGGTTMGRSSASSSSSEIGSTVVFSGFAAGSGFFGRSESRSSEVTEAFFFVVFAGAGVGTIKSSSSSSAFKTSSLFLLKRPSLGMRSKSIGALPRLPDGFVFAADSAAGTSNSSSNES